MPDPRLHSHPHPPTHASPLSFPFLRYPLVLVVFLPDGSGGVGGGSGGVGGRGAEVTAVPRGEGGCSRQGVGSSLSPFLSLSVLQSFSLLFCFSTCPRQLDSELEPPAQEKGGRRKRGFSWLSSSDHGLCHGLIHSSAETAFFPPLFWRVTPGKQGKGISSVCDSKIRHCLYCDPHLLVSTTVCSLRPYTALQGGNKES